MSGSFGGNLGPESLTRNGLYKSAGAIKCREMPIKTLGASAGEKWPVGRQ